MKEAEPVLSIFEYLDYRAFLGEYCRRAKEENPLFSNRHFAAKAGLPVSNASLLSKVIAGKRNLTLDLRFKFGKAMGLIGEEFRYFDLLVQFNQATRMEAKNHFYSELAKYRGSRAKIIKSDEYQYYSKWYFSVIRAFFGYNQKEKNPQTIARLLYPPVSPKEVEEAIKILLDLKLIKRLANGYAVTENHISTEREILDLAGKNRMYEMTRLAMETFDQVPAEWREYNALTVYISQDGFRSIKERIQSFREELREMVEKDRREDRVYTLTMHFFPNVVIPELENEGAKDTKKLPKTLAAE
jgi:uncharacterized protein (TIGR02147 family)